MLVGLNYKFYLVIDKNLIRPAEVDALLADYTKAKKELKWQPKTDIKIGLKKTIDWYIKYYLFLKKR